METVPPADPETQPENRPDTSSTEALSTSYNFIIIGGGTAGLVLAFRLSFDPKISVLVLEAGENLLDDPKITTPALAASMYEDPNYDWGFLTVPQKHVNNRQIPHQRGRVLGGSSAIFQTKMVYTSPSAFNAWEAKGNLGWNWTTMLPYLKKFHTHHSASSTFAEISNISNRDEGINSDSRGEGPIQTSYSETSAADKAWYETWQSITRDVGYEGRNLGGFAAPSSIDPRTKTRSYSGNAYYEPISSRPNLRVVTEANVSQILFAERKHENGELVATGVEFTSKDGEKITITATKEIILSAGTFASPALLELSGIGSPSTLEPLNIPVLIPHENVGENLMDHAMCAIAFEVADGVPTVETMLRSPELMAQAMKDYQRDRSGPLGGSFLNSAHMSLPEMFDYSNPTFLQDLVSKATTGKEKSAIEELHEKTTINLLNNTAHGGATCHYFMPKTQMAISPTPSIRQWMSPNNSPDHNFFTLFASLNSPFSRGNCHITATGGTAKENLMIDPKYLSHDADLELLARHIQFMSTLIGTKPLSGLFKEGGKRIPPHAFPSTSAPTLGEAKDLVRETLLSNYHPAGTCCMAPLSAGGVVDSNLVVHGTKNLRVIDASVFPVMPRGNIITSVYAIAERGADIIRGAWGMV
ncbi:aryl-alcohol dehydrogenase [Halenospora varia]|nr:aryl-alcohol dehydrogenase [Halenospora varia]